MRLVGLFFDHFHILFSLFCHTITIILLIRRSEKKKKSAKFLSHFFFCNERDLIWRIISQCSTIVDQWNVFEDKKTVIFSSLSLSFALYLRALSISVMFSTKNRRKKKKTLFFFFFFIHTTHVFWVFRSLLPPTQWFSCSRCFFFMKRTRKKRRHRESNDE